MASQRHINRMSSQIINHYDRDVVHSINLYPNETIHTDIINHIPRTTDLQNMRQLIQIIINQIARDAVPRSTYTR